MEIKITALLGKSPRDRLTSLKALAARYPHYGDMRQVYRQGFRPLTTRHCPMNASDPERAARRFYENAEQAGLRFVGWADESLRLRHTGWYSDNYAEETFRGAIFRLPSKRGQERFVAGYGESMSDGFVLDLSEVWNDDQFGVAREADRLAERAGEDAREYEAKESASIRIEDIADELKSIRTDILALCRSIREACPDIGQHKPIRSALRSALQSHLHNRKALVVERERLQDNYWSVVPSW
ncbi:MAG: hypothetical protein OQJ97_14310 [Rhodospirillales bacterium]|nr:hypothetical protein [Rhodospirillales bacterium]